MTRAGAGGAARRTAAAGLALLAAAACGGGVSNREAAALVRRYNAALIAAYRQNDASPMDAVATSGETKRIFVLVELKRSNDIVLESDLESLEVTSVERQGPGGLTVETRERWRYFDRPLAPGRPPGTVFVCATALRYEFLRQKGEWKMDRARTLSNEYLEPKGYEPRSQSHAPGGAGPGLPGGAPFRAY